MLLEIDRGDIGERPGMGSIDQITIDVGLRKEKFLLGIGRMTFFENQTLRFVQDTNEIHGVELAARQRRFRRVIVGEESFAFVIRFLGQVSRVSNLIDRRRDESFEKRRLARLRHSVDVTDVGHSRGKSRVVDGGQSVGIAQLKEIGEGQRRLSVSEKEPLGKETGQGQERSFGS